jgi:DNA-binding HxlR family transcriptional regulator
MEAALELIAGKWKLLILYHLADGRQRFGALRRLVGDVSEKIMSEQLKALTADGLVRRIDFHTVPPHVEYELTEFGRDFCASFAAVCDWGSRNMDKVSAIAAARGRPAGKAAPEAASSTSARASVPTAG